MPAPAPPALFLGLDLGGTHLRLGLRRAGEDRLLTARALAADPTWTAEDLHRQIEQFLGPALGLSDSQRSNVPTFQPSEARVHSPPTTHHSPGLAAIALGLTGDIDCRDGVCYSMTRFPRLEGCPLRAFLKERWGVPVRILNDGLTAALAE